MERRKYLFHGQVQGVGFRFTAASIAQRFPITGTVQNLPDGTVQLEVQGAPSEIDAFLSELIHRFTSHITHVSRHMATIVPNESSFSIRR